MAVFKQNYFQRRARDRGPRFNHRINSPEVQVISSNGENLGILSTNEAIAIAKKEGFRTMSDMGREMILSGDLNFREFDRILSMD